MPFADTEAMQVHLGEISAAVAPGAHALLILDQAGWHLSSRLVIPDNITLLPLPLRSPELNPVENVWQFMRQNWLSNRPQLVIQRLQLRRSTPKIKDSEHVSNLVACTN